ncbi:CAMK family protein kinase [Trichomonas vaginalis G3]|uniref:CAMK family protein kinase n=1 Tax=Trichomonas vaginalis (strain ATCC PRA-98 / G3) TaxID=412133 RepID=A2E753_TRIV3|nr:protein serine/threonine kinase protein [Trichomonas vaginalis G3]EAY11571.1 CAMK family protein kinase [Trichomonas vaginalis G3]KAI5489461.1 protein serine/threonine kinase protein [Trichomonas vaginalis G3]|eukprot:XP_001323794.1 CAMK family protein kinase [Trichomonas vaginalis G3]
MNQAEVNFLASKGIKVIKILGKGAYGVVFYVYCDHYKSYFALKKVPEPKFMDGELQCLVNIDDPRVVRLYKKFANDGNIYMLMEYCRTDLLAELRQKHKFTDSQMKSYIRDMALSIKACHDRNAAHSDIKPSNFLIDFYGRLKISDFGMCGIFTGQPCSSKRGGTLEFMAPEIFSNVAYNPIVADIWAFGVSIYLIVVRKFPFDGESDYDIKSNIQEGQYNIRLVKDQQLRDVISRCLEVDVKNRATIDELLKMPYFQDEDDQSTRLVKKSSTKGIIVPKMIKNSFFSRSNILPHNVVSRNRATFA